MSANGCVIIVQSLFHNITNESEEKKSILCIPEGCPTRNKKKAKQAPTHAHTHAPRYSKKRVTDVMKLKEHSLI